MAALIGRDSLRSHIAYRYHIAAKQAGPVRYSLMDRQMAKFSERAGITPPKEIQTQSMDSDLRASLWNLCRRDWFTPHTADLSEDDIYSIATELYEDFYKLPVDSLPYHTEEFVKSQLELFISGPWYKVYDIVEFLCSGFHSGSIGQQQFEVNVNLILEREKAGYRMIDGRITR